MGGGIILFVCLLWGGVVSMMVCLVSGCFCVWMTIVGMCVEGGGCERTRRYGFECKRKDPDIGVT